MNYLLLLLAAVAAAALYFLSGQRKRPPQAERPQRTRPLEVPAALPAVQADSTRDPALRAVVRVVNPYTQDMLQDFTLTRAADLPVQDARAIADMLDRIPRPPSALHKLVSPQYLAQASTNELCDMVMAEPQVAAKVLAVVNSPMYGLKSPLSSIAHAITFLGLNSVRSICLQYLLDDSFRSDDPEIKKIFERLWQVSTLASELCFKLAKRLELPEPGTLVTQVVLSFLGQVASHSLLPKQVVIPMLSRGLLDRSRTEQEALGLCAAELGSLLMQEWELPASIVDRVRSMDMVLLTPCTARPTAHDSAMALCYFSARLAEKLAREEVKSLGTFRVEEKAGAEFFHLQGYLRHPPLTRLTEYLHEPGLVSAIHTMLHAMHH